MSFTKFCKKALCTLLTFTFSINPIINIIEIAKVSAQDNVEIGVTWNVVGSSVAATMLQETSEIEYVSYEIDRAKYRPSYRGNGFTPEQQTYRANVRADLTNLHNEDREIMVVLTDSRLSDPNQPNPFTVTNGTADQLPNAEWHERCISAADYGDYYDLYELDFYRGTCLAWINFLKDVVGSYTTYHRKDPADNTVTSEPWVSDWKILDDTYEPYSDDPGSYERLMRVSYRVIKGSKEFPDETWEHRHFYTKDGLNPSANIVFGGFTVNADDSRGNMLEKNDWLQDYLNIAIGDNGSSRSKWNHAWFNIMSYNDYGATPEDTLQEVQSTLAEFSTNRTFETPVVGKTGQYGQYISAIWITGMAPGGTSGLGDNAPKRYKVGELTTQSAQDIQEIAVNKITADIWNQYNSVITENTRRAHTQGHINLGRIYWDSLKHPTCNGHKVVQRSDSNYSALTQKELDLRHAGLFNCKNQTTNSHTAFTELLGARL